jgi:hypothetical protein
MIDFIELNRTHNRDNFDCGIEELNYFLRNLARQNLKKGLSRTFVAVDKNIPEEVLGFYTLSLFELSSEKLPKKYAKNKAVKKYYQKFGFVSLPDHPLELFLPFATLQKMYEIAISNNVSNTKITSG